MYRSVVSRKIRLPHCLLCIWSKSIPNMRILAAAWDSQMLLSSLHRSMFFSWASHHPPPPPLFSRWSMVLFYHSWAVETDWPAGLLSHLPLILLAPQASHLAVPRGRNFTLLHSSTVKIKVLIRGNDRVERYAMKNDYSKLNTCTYYGSRKVDYLIIERATVDRGYPCYIFPDKKMAALSACDIMYRCWCYVLSLSVSVL